MIGFDYIVTEFLGGSTGHVDLDSIPAPARDYIVYGFLQDKPDWILDWFGSEATHTPEKAWKLFNLVYEGCRSDALALKEYPRETATVYFKDCVYRDIKDSVEDAVEAVLRTTN